MKQFPKSTIFFTISIFLVFLSACDNEPLDPGLIENNGAAASCEETTESLATALTNYSTASPGDANYDALCIAYANALQNMIVACGDTDGALQLLLDSLDCEPSNTGCQDAQIATQTVATAYNANNTSSDLCNAYITALQNEIVICGDTNGDLQTLIDGLDCSGSSSGNYLYFVSGKINGIPFVYGQLENSPIIDYTENGFGNSISSTCTYYPTNGGLNYACGVYPNLNNEDRPSIYFDFIRFYLCSTSEAPEDTFNQSFPVGDYDLAYNGGDLGGSTGDVGVVYFPDSTNNMEIYNSFGIDQTDNYFEISSSTNANVIFGTQVLAREQLIEGTFAVTLFDELNSNTIEITDGMFKLYMAFD